MILKEKSSYLLNKIIPYLKTEKMIMSNNNKTAFNKVLLSLYSDIKKGDNYVKLNLILKPKIVKFNNNKLELYNHHFFPTNIKKYIQDNGKYVLMYECIILDRNINIYFTLFSESDIKHIQKYNKYVENMCTWLYICNLYSDRECNKCSLKIYVNLTPIDKMLPLNHTQTLNAENVNTALTYPCVNDGAIVIFRNEEWMKVFIHETFHSYGFDLSHTSNNLYDFMQNIFPINSEMKLCEAYSETWARIINANLCSYNSLKNKDDVETYLLYVNFSLVVERIWSTCQMNKVLHFMGLEYEDLHKQSEVSSILRKKMYKENSNVFSYYILTSIFLNNYIDFMQLCYDNNAYIYIQNKNLHIKLMELIKSNYNSETFNKLVNCSKNFYLNNKKTKENMNNYLKFTTRMSVIEIV